MLFTKLYKDSKVQSQLTFLLTKIWKKRIVPVVQ